MRVASIGIAAAALTLLFTNNSYAQNKAWSNFKPTRANLEQNCVAAASISFGNNIRYQYILQGARMNGLSAENQLAIMRYMRNNCPEYIQ